MRHARESTLHELYLRASSITKKTAPLKLYANVVGKLTVVRELRDDVCDKLRESTQDAVNQRMTRTTQMIDAPPPMQPNSKKRREPAPPSTMFRKPIRQSDKLISTSGTSNPTNVLNRTSVTATATAQGSREGSNSLRTREGISRESSTAGRNPGGLNPKSAKSGLKRDDGEISQPANTKPQNARSDDGSSLVGKLPAGDREGKNISSEIVKKRHNKGLEPSDSEREGRYVQSNMDKVRAVGRDEGGRVDSKSSKRKTTNRDDSDYLDTKLLPQKRRKTEPLAAHSTASPLPRDEKPMGSSLTLNKSNAEPRTRINMTTKDPPALVTIKKRKDSPGPSSKQEHYPKAKIPSTSSHPTANDEGLRARHGATKIRHSPGPSSKQEHHPKAKLPSTSSYPPANDEGLRTRHGSTKLRRRSPIYTSSEDEELPDSNHVSSHSSSLATPSTLSHSHLPSASGSRTTSRSLLSRSIPTDHTALRARYSTAYLEYLTSFQKLVIQRGMVDRMLQISDSGSAGSVTDSDGGVELLQPDELARLAADHRKRHEELVSIQQMFTTSTRIN